MATRFTYPNKETRHGLSKIVKKLLKPGHGMLVLDESPKTMGKRLKKFNIENTEENRRRFREILFGADRKINQMISGIALHDEAVHEKSESGTPFPRFILDHGVIPGIRMNLGSAPIHGSFKERVPEGLDHFEERCSKYKDMGIDWAKFRGAVKVGRFTPTPVALRENAECLARCASMCQANCMVPVIQPEVLPDGDHDIKATQKVTETFISFLIRALQERHVSMEHVILNPNMIIPGHFSREQQKRDKPEEGRYEMIAERTCRSMARVVPPAVPGICFSSSGMSEEEATVALNKIAQCKANKPWSLSFCYGRGLEPSAMRAWCGETKNINRAKCEFLKRLKACSAAACGKYEPGSVKGLASNFHFHDDHHHH